MFLQIKPDSPVFQDYAGYFAETYLFNRLKLSSDRLIFWRKGEREVDFVVEGEGQTYYALPKNLLVKSVDELRELKEAGLVMIYFGVESGDPVVLEKVQKGATREEMIEGIKKAHEAGLIVSTTNLLGIGGKKYSEQHAKNSASLLSETNPKYISFLTVMYPLGDQRFRHFAPTMLQIICPLRDTSRRTK